MAPHAKEKVMSRDDSKYRSHLPIPTPQRTGLITYDAKDPDTKFPPIEQLRPPKGAPNVLIILIDDAGSRLAGGCDPHRDGAAVERWPEGSMAPMMSRFRRI
jgi:hypothetical protein